MKQVLLILAIALTISGCQKEVIQKNDIQSFNYTATTATWGTSDGGFTWTTNLSVPEITASVLSSGVVNVYVVYTSSGTTYNDPTPIFYPGSGLNISSSISVGSVDIYYESTTVDPVNNPGTYTFRVVVMNGSGKMEYQPAKNEYLIKTIVKP